MKRKIRIGWFRFFVCVLSVLIAAILSIIPLPFEEHWARPEWMSLVLIYWLINEPTLVGVGVAFCVGLIMDGLKGGLIGENALAMTIVAYLTYLLRNQLRLHSFWTRSLCILVLVGFGQLTILCTRWCVGNPPQTLLVWLSTLTSVLLWPLIFRLLHFYGRKNFD